MTIEKIQGVFDLVKMICDTQSTIPAVLLLNEMGVSSAAEIAEIPLCWNNQVGVRFTLGEWDEVKNRIVFSFYAGVHKDDPTKFFVALYVENFDKIFPVKSDDEMCHEICLFEDIWTIDGDKIIE